MCGYVTKHPCHGFRRAWAALRRDEGRGINVKKLHRLWCEEGLPVRVHSPRKRAGTSSAPAVIADAPKVVWAIDFQFDSTIDGTAIKIASMVDEHTRESLLYLVERSITAEPLVAELKRVFAVAGGGHARIGAQDRVGSRRAQACVLADLTPADAEDRPQVLWMDNGPEMVSQALQQFCEGKVGLSYIPPGTPWNGGYIESFNNRLRKECLNRNHWTTLLEARVVQWRLQGGAQHTAPPLSALGCLTPAEYSAVCSHTHIPVACEIN